MNMINWNFISGTRNDAGGVRSALAVIRVSGPKCGEVLSKVGGFGLSKGSSAEWKLPEERKAILRKLRDPVTSEVLDKGILLWFPGIKALMMIMD
jgi:tRNA modification GTPase